MCKLACLLSAGLLLQACAETARTGPGVPPGTIPENSAIFVAYDLKTLPLSDPVRLDTTFDLAALAGPEGRRICGPSEAEFAELSVILKAVQDEEWRTSPWSAEQRAQVVELQRRWDALGGRSRSLSKPCADLVARISWRR
ncbi:hypothetical protein AYJ57_00865 [Salipiger sp. CCB-MM3]|uniref:hypothetical protein n=1 Tax=Salipiger sp. CCB-MM3 TaxID=1792508 RepID=UPI00080A9FB1|nr:hypothetical protein [Salipiger sp. CCB-MM3]ANT59035.1 hypothetical protein AYJ57_00865 [Salipiger sp. CCB-MM3]